MISMIRKQPVYIITVKMLTSLFMPPFSNSSNNNCNDIYHFRTYCHCLCSIFLYSFPASAYGIYYPHIGEDAG